MEQTNDIDLEKLLELKNSKVNEKWNYFKMFKKMDEIIKELDFQIYKKCNHEWERDYSGGPYDRAEQICKFCNLYRNHYIYN